MKMKSVSGVVCYVKDIGKTVEFYEKLGFIFKSKDDNRATAYLNWFWLDFIAVKTAVEPKFNKEANLPNKGAGQFLYISVDNVDEAYKDIISEGLEPSSEPRDWPWGNREFVIRDPDGYKLIIFKRK